MRARVGAGVLVLLTGCIDEPAMRGDAISVLDSAGIEVIRHPGDPFVGGQADPVEPVASHGLGLNDYAFDRPIDGALLPNGDFVLADVGTAEVVRIAADGSAFTVLAQTGEGPGEVRAPISVVRLGPDSVLIEDDGNSKFLVLSGGEVASVLSVAGRGELAYGLRTHAVGPDGELFMGTSSFVPSVGEDWIMGSMVVVDPTAMGADTVASFEMAFPVPQGGPHNPFAPFGQISASDSGFVFGRSDLPELVWHSVNGSVHRIVRWTPVRQFPDDEDMAQVIEGYRAALPRMNRGLPPEQLERLVQRESERLRLSSDEPLPLYVELTDHGAEGVWLSQFSPGVVGREGASAYLVVSANGHLLRRVDLPRVIRVLDVAHGRVLGVARDDTDVQYAVVYRLVGRP